MMEKNPKARIAETAELLDSLKRSVTDLRKMAEDLKARIEGGEEGEIPDGRKRLAECSALIRSCHSVEVQLVKLENEDGGVTQGGRALDLDAMRAEIGCRLDRLRRCNDADEVS